jgi:hypothetical protein
MPARVVLHSAGLALSTSGGLCSATGSMSSAAITAVASNCLFVFWGVLNCSPTPAVNCAAPSYGTSLCPSSFLVQLCTPFPSPRVVLPGRSTASEAGPLVSELGVCPVVLQIGGGAGEGRREVVPAEAVSTRA